MHSGTVIQTVKRMLAVDMVMGMSMRRMATVTSLLLGVSMAVKVASDQLKFDGPAPRPLERTWNGLSVARITCS